MVICSGQFIHSFIFSDSHAFWQGILSVGLVDDFFKEIKYGLDALKGDLIKSHGSPAGKQSP